MRDLLLMMATLGMFYFGYLLVDHCGKYLDTGSSAGNIIHDKNTILHLTVTEEDSKEQVLEEIEESICKFNNYEVIIYKRQGLYDIMQKTDDKG